MNDVAELAGSGRALELGTVTRRPSTPLYHPTMVPEAELEKTDAGLGPYGAYTVDEVALRHGACVDEETQDAEVAYARVPTSEPTPYREGWLPSS